MTPVRPQYLDLDEEANALDYLDKACSSVAEAEVNPLAWKWVVLALHGALYGFAICACKGTDPNNVIRRTKKGKELLISFDEALRLCQDPKWIGMTVTAKPLVLTESQQCSIDLLKNLLRNNFEHYIPRSWAIEVHGMPTIVMDVLDAIQFLALDTGTYVSLEEEQQEKIRTLVGRTKRILLKSRLYQEAIGRAQPKKGSQVAIGHRRIARKGK